MRLRALLVAALAASLGWVIPATAATPNAVPPNLGKTVSNANPLAHCDPIDPAQCMLPYPDDYFTTPDPSSATGLRLNFNALAMPTNREGKPIDPSDYNLSDGFSAGSQILTYVPGMTSNADLAPSGLPADTDVSTYAAPNAGVVLLDTKTGRRWPVWAEVDQYASTPSDRLLMIHPAVNLTDGTRYIVALRHLRLDNGAFAQPSAGFKAYRDGTASSSDPRTAHFADIFGRLARAGVDRKGLYLAWDFTTASTANVTGRLLTIRNDAFRDLGDTNLRDNKLTGSAPAFTVDKIADNPNPKVAKEITGHFTVPCYIAPTCTYTGRFLLNGSDTRSVPQRIPGQTYSASFDCIVPAAPYAAHAKLRPSLYGHGLFGSPSEVEAGNVEDMANEHGMLECGTEWYGMAETDVPDAIAALQDLSLFPTLVDRVQQGELDFLYLARLMQHPAGFCSSPDFQYADHSCAIDTRAVYYDGNSQGGIYGGTVCAVSPDVRQCVLGVPGEDYTILLPRSSDYVADKPITDIDPSDPTGNIGYSDAFDLGYPDPSQRILIMDIIQTLWDRADPSGYASHMTTSPLPDTPTHRVLMQMAWGDHQVANVTAITEARTIGARLVGPPLVSWRYGPWTKPFFGLAPITHYPYAGSALAVFDTGPVRTVNGSVHGTDPPPPADVPNRSGDDPHEAPRATVCGRDMKSAFLLPNGSVTDPCGGPPYFADGWDGTH